MKLIRRKKALQQMRQRNTIGLNHPAERKLSITSPNINEPKISELKYAINVFLPRVFPITVIVAALVAGLAIKKTRVPREVIL
jgi:hypothetical protein